MTPTPFVGRQRELSWLLERLQGQASQLLVLHGRRRIGKTRLVREAFERLGDDHALYYLATLKNATLQRRELQQLLAAKTGDPLLARHPFDEWEALLTYLVRQHPRLVLALDEFPYLVTADPAFASVLQKVWDEHARTTGVRWIVLGSQVTAMERVLDHDSPLYGRRTGAWHLQPLGFDDLCAYSGLEGLEALRYYGFAGGIPFYWEALGFEGYTADIRKAALAPGSLLYDEGGFLVREELRQPREYFSLLHLLARGPRALGDLCGELGIGKHIAGKYLSVLQGLHVLERQVPITRVGTRSAGLYAMTDPFLRFWFRFVFPYKTSLEMGAHEVAEQRMEAEGFDHLATVYEDVALERLAQRAAAEGRPLFGKGRWWLNDKGRQYQINGVLLAEGETWVLEAKIGGRVKPARLEAAVAALREDAHACGVELGKIRCFAFEAQRRFEGEELVLGGQAG